MHSCPSLSLSVCVCLCLSVCVWYQSGLRIALAVDSHIFFANIRPDYLAAYFSHTLVYAVLKKERNEYAVIFWDTRRDEVRQ